MFSRSNVNCFKMSQDSEFPFHDLLNAKKSTNDGKKDSLVNKLLRPETENAPRRKKDETNHDQSNFLQSNYHDYSNEPGITLIANDVQNRDAGSSFISFGNKANSNDSEKPRRGPRGGVVSPFPEKLHRLLEKVERDGHSGIISWKPHGRCFIMHKPKEFVKLLMPLYFRQTKLTSFQRQLNLYGFCRLTSGLDKGCYYHELFLRGKPSLCKKMIRIRIKGTGIKSSSKPESEPNFYIMPRIKPDDLMTAPSSPPKNLESCEYEGSQSTKMLAPLSPRSCDYSFNDGCTSFQHITRSSIPYKSVTPSPYDFSVPTTNSNPPKPISDLPQLPLFCPPKSDFEGYEKSKLPFKTKILNDDSKSLSNSVTRDQAVKFEGKQFHYLDSYISCASMIYDSQKKDKYEVNHNTFVSRRRSVTFDGKNDPVISGKPTTDSESDWYSEDGDEYCESIIPSDFLELVGIPMDTSSKISDTDESSFGWC